MPNSSDNHNFDLDYAEGETWSYNSEFNTLEQKVIVRDTDANTGEYTPHTDAIYWATDTGDVYLGDGTAWNQLGHAGTHEQGGGDEITHNNLALNADDHHTRPSAGAYLTDDSNTFNVDSAQRLIDSPNGTPPTALLEDGDALEISVPVADSETLTVYRWGGYLIADGTAPTNLDVQLLDGSDTVQASANTSNNSSTTGVASHTNTSGTQSIFKLRVNNATGTNYTTDGVGGVFGYEVA